MTIFQSIILGIIQGVTEFLPVSSSGHLVVFETIFGLKVADLLDFDIMIHLGTLLAILIYFRKDILELLKFKNPQMIANLIIATIPAVIIGLLYKDQIEETFRSVTSVSILMMTVGALFFIPEKFFIKAAKKLNLKNSFVIGLAQSLALIPGVSRSGATILTGTWLGIERKEAARFSFLLGSIAIAGAGVLGLKDMNNLGLPNEILFTGFLSSFIAGIISIKFLMGFLKKYSLKAFGLYRIVFGILLLLFMK